MPRLTDDAKSAADLASFYQDEAMALLHAHLERLDDAGRRDTWKMVRDWAATLAFNCNATGNLLVELSDSKGGPNSPGLLIYLNGSQERHFRIKELEAEINTLRSAQGPASGRVDDAQILELKNDLKELNESLLSERAMAKTVEGELKQSEGELKSRSQRIENQAEEIKRLKRLLKKANEQPSGPPPEYVEAPGDRKRKSESKPDSADDSERNDDQIDDATLESIAEPDSKRQRRESVRVLFAKPNETPSSSQSRNPIKPATPTNSIGLKTLATGVLNGRYVDSKWLIESFGVKFTEDGVIKIATPSDKQLSPDRVAVLVPFRGKSQGPFKTGQQRGEIFLDNNVVYDLGRAEDRYEWTAYELFVSVGPQTDRDRVPYSYLGTYKFKRCYNLSLEQWNKLDPHTIQNYTETKFSRFMTDNGKPDVTKVEGTIRCPRIEVICVGANTKIISAIQALPRKN